MPTLTDLARLAYQAWAADQRHPEPWEQLPRLERMAWVRAALAVLDTTSAYGRCLMSWSDHDHDPLPGGHPDSRPPRAGHSEGDPMPIPTSAKPRWTIFGREPALVVGFIGAALIMLATFGFDWLSPEHASLIVAALSAATGAVTAWLTRPIAPGAFTALVTAVAALAAGYGLELPPETLGATNALVIAILALITRGEVSPAGRVDPSVLGTRD